MSCCLTGFSEVVAIMHISCLVEMFGERSGKVVHVSLVPRPSQAPVIDPLQYAKMEREELVIISREPQHGHDICHAL